MPIRIKFITPTGRTKIKDRKNKIELRDCEKVIFGDNDRGVIYETVTLAAQTVGEGAVNFGSFEILGVVRAAVIVFQRLVARTPMDEDYDLSIDSRYGDVGNGNYHHHKADNERIRDHWRMDIVIDGSYKTSVFAKSFSDDLFINANDHDAVKKILKDTLSNLKVNVRFDKGKFDLDYDISYENDSPYFAKLEYGGYKKKKGNNINQGKFFEHGVTEDGFSIQAPSGFYRRTLLDLRVLLKEGCKKTVANRLSQTFKGKIYTKKQVENLFGRIDEIKVLKSKGVDIDYNKLRIGETIEEVCKFCSRDEELLELIIGNLKNIDKKFPRTVKLFENKIFGPDETGDLIDADKDLYVDKNGITQWRGHPTFVPDISRKGTVKAIDDEYNINIDAIKFESYEQKLKYEKTLNRFISKKNGKQENKYGRSQRNTSSFSSVMRLYDKYANLFPDIAKIENSDHFIESVLYGNSKKRKEAFENAPKEIEIKVLSQKGLNALINRQILKKNRSFYIERESNVYRLFKSLGYTKQYSKNTGLKRLKSEPGNALLKRKTDYETRAPGSFDEWLQKYGEQVKFYPKRSRR